jgi:hypothetical protein
MKKFIITIALALTASIVAQAQPVYSNTVGMIKIEVDEGDMVLIQTPFQSDDIDLNVTELFGVDLPVGSEIFYWVADGDQNERQRYRSIQLTKNIFKPTESAKWSDNIKTFARGEGFFLRIGDNGDENVDTISVTLSGNVPDQNSEPSTTKTLVFGLQMLGVPYPVPADLTEEDSQEPNPLLGLNPSVGDVIYYWANDAGTGTSRWFSSTFTKNVFKPSEAAKWSNTLSLTPGMAVFYSSMDQKEWITTVSNFYTLD